ncbi:MAG: hypothetical protein KL787_01470 [Taibaiella sp.]|nr:hypothetical protein [Taibaiella sp.]
MNIAFITNGSLSIGFGHISRTRMLYSFFTSKNNSVKIIVPESCIFSFDGDFVVVRSFCEQDLEFLESDYDVVIIDSIESDYDSLSWLSKTKLFIVSITLFMFDLKKRFEHISFFPSVKDSEIITASRTKIYVGRDYLTFREEFNHSYFQINPDSKKIIVTMGGTDPYSLTLKVLKSLV